MRDTAVETPVGERRPAFLLVQVLRGVAALLVVAHHATILEKERLGGPQTWWKNGASGVDIFFVISGFVIALSARHLAGGLTAAGTFMRRRLERVIPLYWLVTTLKVVLLLAVPGLALHGLGPWSHVCSSYLFFPTLDDAGSFQPVLIVGWTLNYEMFFYVCFALALLLKVKPIGLLVPLLSVMALLGWRAAPMTRLGWYGNPILFEFVFGMLLYLLTSRGKTLRAAWAWPVLVLGFAGLLAVPTGAETMWRPVVWGLPALAIVAASIGLEAGLRRWVRQWMLDLGDASYSIYLSHTLSLPLAAKILLVLHLGGGRMRFGAEGFAVVVSVGVGLGLYRFVEAPVNRYFGRRRFRASEQGGPTREESAVRGGG